MRKCVIKETVWSFFNVPATFKIPKTQLEFQCLSWNLLINCNPKENSWACLSHWVCLQWMNLQYICSLSVSFLSGLLNYCITLHSSPYCPKNILLSWYYKYCHGNRAFTKISLREDVKFDLMRYSSFSILVNISLKQLVLSYICVSRYCLTVLYNKQVLSISVWPTVRGRAVMR